MKTLKLSIVATFAVLAAACGAVSNGDDGATGSPTPTNTPTGGLTIADIQKGNVEESTSVTLEGVVVTAIKVGGSGVDFWAQDVGGGAQSGLYFFDRDGLTPADIAVGDEVTVSGLYTEFYDLSEVTIESVEITNNGLTPDVDAVSIADLADPAQVEVWESCLVELSDAGLSVSGSVNQYSEFPVSDGTDTILVDDLLYDATADISSGAPVAYLAGVVNYAFEEWKLLPRDEFDLEVEVVPVVAAPIADIRGGLVAENDYVDVEDAIVVAIDVVGSGTTQRNHFWIQQGTGANSGILVFDLTNGDPAGVAVGDLVNLRNVKYVEYKGTAGNPWTDGLSELELAADSLIEVTSSGNTVEITTVTLADLVVTAEDYEGVLVDVSTDVTISDLNADDNPENDGTPNFKEYLVTDATNTIRVNDSIVDTLPGKSVSQSITTLRGVFNYNFSNYKLEPRDQTDVQ